MYGVDCIFELRKKPDRVQDCRVLVAFVPEWDTNLDAVTDALAVVIAHAGRAVVDGWKLSAVHARCIDEFAMETLTEQRAAGYATEWYGVPCRILEGKKCFWVEGNTHG